MSDISGDLRYAFRGLRRSPLFAVIAVLTLALGIGATTAIFTLIDQVVLRRLPVPDAGHAGADPPGRAAQRQQHGALDELLPHVHGLPAEGRPRSPRSSRGATCRASLAVDNQTERVDAELVSGNFFTMLGVKPAVGRVFSSQEDDRVYNGHPVVVLSHDYWVNRFQGDPKVVGRKITVNNYPMTIVGVSAAGFSGLDPTASPDIRVPILMQPTLMPAMVLAQDGRPAGALGAGVRAAEAGLHGGNRRAGDAGALPADPPVRDDAAGGQGLDRFQPPAVHEGHS